MIPRALISASGDGSCVWGRCRLMVRLALGCPAGACRKSNRLGLPKVSTLLARAAPGSRTLRYQPRLTISEMRLAAPRLNAAPTPRRRRKPHGLASEPVNHSPNVPSSQIPFRGILAYRGRGS